MADGKIVVDVTADSTGAIKSLASVEGKAQSTHSKIGTYAKAAAATATAAFTSFAAAAYSSFEAVEEGANAVKTATGATGEAAEELVDVYEEVATKVSGSYEEIGSAVGELNTRLDLTGDALEDASEQAMKFAKVNGTDATTSIQNVASMMNNAGIDASEYSKILDELTVAAQKSGIGVDELASSANTNAATLKAMGFSTEESIALLAQFEKTGANTSKILRGMKTAAASWTSEGKDATQEFQAFVKGVKSGTVTAADAIDTFGSTTGQIIYDAALNGQMDYEDMFEAIANGSEGALNDMYEDTLTISEKLEVAKKNVQVMLSDFASPFVEAASDALSAGVDVLGNDGSVLEIAQAMIASVAKSLTELANSFTADDVTNVVTSLANAVTEDSNGNQSLANACANIGGNLIQGIGVYVGQHGADIVNAIADAIFNAGSGLVSGIVAGATGQEYHQLTLENGEFHWNASGGIFDKATLLGGNNVVGEAGSEAVIPLTSDVLAQIGAGIQAASGGGIDYALMQQAFSNALAANVAGISGQQTASALVRYINERNASTQQMMSGW